MRIPWLMVGTLGGIVVAAFLLLLVVDSTFGTQKVVIVGSLFGGLLVGFLLDYAMNSPKSQ